MIYDNTEPMPWFMPFCHWQCAEGHLTVFYEDENILDVRGCNGEIVMQLPATVRNTSYMDTGLCPICDGYVGFFEGMTK